MNAFDESEHLEVVSPDVIQAMEMATLENAAMTARRYPRNIGKFVDRVKSDICRDEELAEECSYRLKRKGRDGIKIIEGPSIRLLEICFSHYEHLRCGTRVIKDGSGENDRQVIVQGVGTDLQKNSHVSAEVSRSIRTKEGRKFSDDMINVTIAAAASIAMRNALMRLIPRYYVNHFQAYAKDFAFGKNAKNIAERRQKAIDYFTRAGVSLDRILARMEVGSVEEITLQGLEELNGIKVAVKEGDSTFDHEFPESAESKEKSSRPDFSSRTRTPRVRGEEVPVKSEDNPPSDPKPEPPKPSKAEEKPADKPKASEPKQEEKTEAAESGKRTPLEQLFDNLIAYDLTERDVLHHMKKFKQIKPTVERLSDVPVQTIERLNEAIQNGLAETIEVLPLT